MSSASLRLRGSGCGASKAALAFDDGSNGVAHERFTKQAATAIKLQQMTPSQPSGNVARLLCQAQLGADALLTGTAASLRSAFEVDACAVMNALIDFADVTSHRAALFGTMLKSLDCVRRLVVAVHVAVARGVRLDQIRPRVGGSRAHAVSYWLASWLKEVRGQRRRLVQRGRCSRLVLSGSFVTLLMMQIEVGLLSVPDPQATVQAVRAAFTVGVGLAKSVATSSADRGVLEGGIELARLATRECVATALNRRLGNSSPTP